MRRNFSNKMKIYHVRTLVIVFSWLIGASTLTACGQISGSTTSASSSSKQPTVASSSTKAASAFKGVTWSNVQLPGKNLVLSGFKANTACEMKPYSTSKTNALIYYFELDHKAYAVVPGVCSTVNQSPVSFFLFAAQSIGQPKLEEVIYEGNLGVGKLTTAVPTASIARTKPHPWLGYFNWNWLDFDRKGLAINAVNGIQLSGDTLTIYGKVIPPNAKSPLPYASGKGLVAASYLYRWDGSLFRFLKSTAGVPPVSLYRSQMTRPKN